MPVGVPPSFTLEADERFVNINQVSRDVLHLPPHDQRTANVFHDDSDDSDNSFDSLIYTQEKSEKMDMKRLLSQEHLTNIGVLIRDGHVCLFLGFDQQTDEGVWKNEIRWQSSGFIYNFDNWMGEINAAGHGTVYTGFKLEFQITIEQDVMQIWAN